MTDRYSELMLALREIDLLASAAHLLGWDQETMMPPRAAAHRAEELSLLARLAHDRATAPEIGDALAACEADAALLADESVRANLREVRRDYDRARRLPSSLVGEIQETASRALEAWKAARRDSDFALFAPWLERHLALARRKAQCYGWPADGEAYDALLDEYEPGMTGRRLEGIFGPLREGLTPLIDRASGGRPPDESIQAVRVPIPLQQAFNGEVLEALGFDVDAGRIDVSVHPFSSGVGIGDTRITTRYTDDRFADALSSTMHEAGHALYEQGLPKERFPGQPLAEALGLGIHESQSRLWENHVGRSRAFWNWVWPLARRRFGAALHGFDAETAYRAINVVRPNLIRVDSDEVTYNLHIMLRFDLERAMLRGDLSVGDLPAAWNERIAQDLGLDVPDDARGCLQDIHWSMGSIGYFPTYTLGTLYAAQFWEAADRAIDGLEARIEQGRFDALLGWLRASIHEHGRRHPADELCRRLTGESLGHEPLMRHLRARVAEIYG